MGGAEIPRRPTVNHSNIYCAVETWLHIDIGSQKSVSAISKRYSLQMTYAGILNFCMVVKEEILVEMDLNTNFTKL